MSTGPLPPGCGRGLAFVVRIGKALLLKSIHKQTCDPSHHRKAWIMEELRREDGKRVHLSFRTRCRPFMAPLPARGCPDEASDRTPACSHARLIQESEVVSRKNTL